MRSCTHEHLETIYATRYEPYLFFVERCAACSEVTVRVWGDDGSDKLTYLGVLPTYVASYAGTKSGWAYCWSFGGREHNTPPIAPIPAHYERFVNGE